MHGSIITERVKVVTENKIAKEQEGFKSGSGCVDQGLALRMVGEKMLAVEERVLMLPYWILKKLLSGIDSNVGCTQCVRCG